MHHIQIHTLARVPCTSLFRMCSTVASSLPARAALRSAASCRLLIRILGYPDVDGWAVWFLLRLPCSLELSPATVDRQSLFIINHF